jgi:hypothetical protein
MPLPLPVLLLPLFLAPSRGNVLLVVGGSQTIFLDRFSLNRQKKLD